MSGSFFVGDMMEKIENAEMILIGIGEEFDNNPDAVTAYNHLAELLDKKNYFIVSLCMDDLIFQSNLDKNKVVAPLGGFSKKQCPDACTHDLYETETDICPNCGKTLVFNNIKAPVYVEEGYLPQWQKQRLWLTGTLNKKLLVLELGVSLRFPQIVRWPFEKIVEINEKSELIRVNNLIPQLGENVAKRGISINKSSVEWTLSL